MKREPEQRQWATDIKVAHPRCVICHTEKDLHAHHVLKYEEYPAHRLDKTNGITVCKRCHGIIHTAGGKFGKARLHEK